MSIVQDALDAPPPLVTVAMPVYNAGKYLRLAVLSIVKQTFTDWEMLIIDDGSTDDALKDIVDIDDARIRIYRDGVNKGLAARLNECIDMAQGQYFARMDQDDVSFPERFEYQVKALQRDPLIDLVAVRAITISGADQFTGWLPCATTQQEISAKPWRGFYLPHPSWMGKTAWFRHYRYMIPGPYFCEDQELLLRSYDKSRFEMIFKPLFAYRVRDDINWAKQIKTRWAVLGVQLRYFLPKRHVYFAALALMTFFGRVAADVLKFTIGIAFLYAGSERKAVSLQWQSVLNFIEKPEAQNESVVQK